MSQKEIVYPLHSGDWHRDAKGNLTDKSVKNEDRELEPIEKVNPKPAGSTVTKANSVTPKDI